MSEHTPRRRPSNDLAEVGDQLLRELARLEAGPGAEGVEGLGIFRTYLEHATALVWRRLSRGEANAPREALDLLVEAQPFIDSHLPTFPDLRTEAAVQIHSILRCLYLADQAVEGTKVEARLADRKRSRTEREVLRVLLAHQDEYLPRGEVHKKLKRIKAPGSSRIGQILAELYYEGLSCGS